MPVLEVGDHEAGVWALAAEERGRLLVTGTEEGTVAAWDTRAPRQPAWQVTHARFPSKVQWHWSAAFHQRHSATAFTSLATCKFAS